MTIRTARNLQRFTPSLALAPLLLWGWSLLAQSTATLQGTVSDQSGAVVPSAKVGARSQATGVERTTQTDSAGNYLMPALPVGTYRLEVRAEGFQTQVASDLKLEVGQTVVQNFQLQLGAVTQEVTISAAAAVVETTTMTVGQVINQRTVQEIPLNGRHFVDLALLAPGSVTPPQNGFLTAPLRGQGSFGVVTAGNREDTVNFMINGINLNDIVQNQITFQPSINTVSEFKLVNSTLSAEFGHTSGSVVNIATRSGTNDLHGEIFEFVRNDALDAKNFFDNPNAPIPPFKRNQFGFALGGPTWIPSVYDGRNKTFWFFSYEGLRQRQAVTFNRQVPTDAERAGATDPVAQRLLPLIPAANVPGTSTFAGSGSAPVDINQWTLDVNHQLRAKDHLHGYYVRQKDLRREPAAPVSASTLPGFGDIRQATRQLFTFNETHTFTSNIVNAVRVGGNRLFITFNGANTQDPTQFGFTGLSSSGLPEIFIQSTDLNFAGVANFPQGRGDTTAVIADTLSWLRGRHDVRLGAEIRRSYNNNFNRDTGRFIFSNVANFAAGRPSQFTFLQQSADSSIVVGAWQFFVQDNYKIRPTFTAELGLRYEINTTPNERFNRLVAFDPATGSLRQPGSSGFDKLYPTNHNFMPRVGFAWDPFGHGKTSIRGGYGLFYDQPVTNSVSPLASNPPFSNRVTITNPPSFGNPFLGTPAGGALQPNSISPDFRNSYIQNWNINLQHAVLPDLGIMVGYFASKGTHLRLSRNLNQPLGGALPYPTVALIDGTTRTASIIPEIDSLGNSSYNALWVSANKRFSRGLQFNASYTLSKSLDYNSRNTQPIVLQDSRNPRGNRGLSDFDARQRFVISYLYELPFHAQGFLLGRAVEGWALSGATTFQSGNPVTITLGGVSALTNVAQTVRPNLSANPGVPRQDPANFFNPLAFAGPASGRFGTLGRNSFVIGPGFSNFDFSILKQTSLTERLKVEFRTEVFNLLNHPNFGQPVGICTASAAPFSVSSPPGIEQVFPAGTCVPNASFGIIQNASTGAAINPTSFGEVRGTRSPTGDAGSARQIQFALKLIF